MLLRTHEPVHKAFVVYAVLETKHVANLVGHYVASTDQEVLLGVFVLNPVPRRVVAAEGEGTDSYIISGPAEAEVPAFLRVQIFVCETNHAVGVSGLVPWQGL